MGTNLIKTILRSFCLNELKEEIIDSNPDWLIETGLGSIVYDYSVFTNAESDVEIKLNANKLSAKFWYQSQLDQTINILSRLNQLGIVPTLLKGISVSAIFYPQPYYRMMRDIDILLEKEQIEVVEKVLPELGFEQKSIYSEAFYKSLHHTMPWQHRKNKIWLEVHHNLFPQTSRCFNSKTFHLETVNKEKYEYKFKEQQVNLLSNEFQIVYISTHWAEKFKHLGGVFGLLDVALIINRIEQRLDWDKIVELANNKYISDYIYVVLKYLHVNKFLKPSIDVSVYYKQLAHHQSWVSYWLLSKIIDNYIIEGKSFGRVLTIDNVAILWKHLFVPKNKIITILQIPFAIIFPTSSNKRFSLSFQYSRIKSLFKKR